MIQFEIHFNWEIEPGVTLPLRVFGSRHRSSVLGAKVTSGLRVYSGHRLPEAVESKLLNDEKFLLEVVNRTQDELEALR